MRILFLDCPCFKKIDAQFSLEQVGHDFFHFFIKAIKNTQVLSLIPTLRHLLGISTMTIVSTNCQKLGIKYIYSYTLMNPCNYVFIFDKQEYLKFKNSGINTVYYTTLSVNSTIIGRLMTRPFKREHLSADEMSLS